LVYAGIAALGLITIASVAFALALMREAEDEVEEESGLE
jgi:hypothetical protein